ncbi:MAG: helical backbone metal receptor [Acidobacteriota bacterium]
MTRRSLLALAAAAVAWLELAAASWPAPAAAQAPARIVSLVPALTEMLFAIGAGRQVVGVSSYDTYPPEVERLPRVGALIDPDVERILSLKPDLVVIYGSQTDLRTQLARAAIPVFEYRHGGLPHVTGTVRALGVRTGHAAEADELADRIDARLAAVRARVAGRERPRTLLVFGRERGALRGIYASGGTGFLHDMLEAAGGVNVFADIALEAVQVSTEQILARRPDVILEMRSTDIPEGAELEREIRAWAPLASVPAVQRGRIRIIAGSGVTVPGPRVVDGVERMAAVLHP